MNSSKQLRTGAQLLVDALRVHKTDTAFCVPGESYLAVLDALYDVKEQIKLIVCRQEGGAAFMADAYGKLTGKPGICFVTRGPGASNAAIGLHTAHQDSSPMILFIGQIGSDVTEREAFQEVDYRRMFGQMSKWVAQIDRADRVTEMVSHAFHLAVSGRPGPVVLALPEDMLVAQAPAAIVRPYQRIAAHPGASDLKTLCELLGAAQRPLVILGGGDWSSQACADMQVFSENFGLPMTCSFRRIDLFDNRHDLYVGEVGIVTSPELKKRVMQADLIVTIGARLGEMTTAGYTLFQVPKPATRFVHVHPGAEELGRVYQADLMINSGMPEFAAALRQLPGISSPKWTAWRQEARADYLKNIESTSMPGDLNLSEVMAILRKRLPADAILTNGAGNYSGWVQRFYQYSGLRTYLGPTSGAMGYGVPAAVAAGVVHPNRTVVSFSGDGCFLMNGQELATAAQYGLKVIFIVVNNGMYGTIRMHQEREYPERVHGTSLSNPDFALLARAYGLYGEIVTKTEDFEVAFERAMAHHCSALLELRIDPDAISTRAKLSGLREQALKAGR